MTLDKVKIDLKVEAVQVDKRMARHNNGKAAGYQAMTTLLCPWINYNIE